MGYEAWGRGRNISSFLPFHGRCSTWSDTKTALPPLSPIIGRCSTWGATALDGFPGRRASGVRPQDRTASPFPLFKKPIAPCPYLSIQSSYG
ncbi:MAG: hypothetical protein KME31_14340 [Tolypothrix carrinoi HA7290-LM1]|jgi:hypothetical protein|nr:hypothetical protein [Tolypothrix carrinoi HA7290-LM1]